MKTTTRERAAGLLPIGVLLALATLIATAWPAPATAEPIEVSASRLSLNPAKPHETRLGRLVYRGGLRLSADAAWFGGFSGMAVSADGARLIAMSDRGAWLTARLDHDEAGRLTGLGDASLELMALPMGGATFDPEALMLSADGALLAATERDHRLLRYAGGAAGDDPFALDAHRLSRRVPVEMKVEADFSVMPSNAGIEALVRLADGRLLAIEEGPDGEADGLSHAWLIDDDGASAALHYRRANNFRPTDAAILPDGDLVVLERRYTTVGGVAARLKLVPGASIRPGAVLEGTEVATLIPPVTVDNMEALAVYERDGEIRLLILSDDNFNTLQRTLLLQFALRPADAR
ncbi:MAG: esterase-like activity of phytase family protein [Alphaproteobacteria bacterium]